MALEPIGPGKLAVITGGASGIGLAAAQQFAERGMALALIDVRPELFSDAESSLLKSGAREVLTRQIDVTNRTDLGKFCVELTERYGGVDLLMCNAGIAPRTDILGSMESWAQLMDVNLWGVINCCQIFVPGMIERAQPAIVINTGSKQGFTTPPGNPAYNLSKAGVKVFTEALEHHLRENSTGISAHLLVPGYVFTDMTRGGQSEKPASAWTPEQTAKFMMERLGEGDFYILCPDGDVTREMDKKRMAWAVGDMIENRPPLSRWHKDWSTSFEEYMKK